MLPGCTPVLQQESQACKPLPHRGLLPRYGCSGFMQASRDLPPSKVYLAAAMCWIYWYLLPQMTERGAGLWCQALWTPPRACLSSPTCTIVRE